MTELQAEQAASVPRIEIQSQRARYRDLLIALAAFAVLASLPMFFGSKALLDFVIRCSAFDCSRPRSISWSATACSSVSAPTASA